YNKKRKLYFYIYFSKQLAPAEYNYKIYNKKLLIIIRYIKAWDIKLYSISEFKVIINYKNLEYFYILKKLFKKYI
ncbi:uncharacterized protein BO88DRAFT_333278, partial [Aspergillus vadensis CBS 113365]